jgi:sulfur relay (sulfurtransferase) DsrF/TusC family protein
MEFEERKVLVLVRSKPFGQIINFEGWRAAVGMIGMDHEPTMLFMDDGVYSLLKTIDVKPIRMFKATYLDFDGRLCASKKALDDRKIGPDEIFEEVEVLDEGGIAQALTENEVVITF